MSGRHRVVFDLTDEEYVFLEKLLDHTTPYISGEISMEMKGMGLSTTPEKLEQIADSPAERLAGQW